MLCSQNAWSYCRRHDRTLLNSSMNLSYLQTRRLNTTLSMIQNLFQSLLTACELSSVTMTRYFSFCVYLPHLSYTAHNCTACDKWCIRGTSSTKIQLLQFPAVSWVDPAQTQVWWAQETCWMVKQQDWLGSWLSVKCWTSNRYAVGVTPSCSTVVYRLWAKNVHSHVRLSPSSIMW